ncbi:hypothetical protein ACLBWX_05775 [Methylobacterium sp. M6A4_1b]
MIEADAFLVLARAKLNFARKSHGERCWDADGADAHLTSDCTLLPLSETERAEFLEQARHELRQEAFAS